MVIDGETILTMRDTQPRAGDVSIWSNFGPPPAIRRLELLDLDAPGQASVSPSPSPPVSSSSTSNSIQTFAGHRYQFVPGAVTWDEAKAKAAGMGGHLATVTSQAENAWLYATFGSRLDPAQRASSIWLGGMTEASGQPWKWVTSEPFTFTDWTKDEPDYATTKGQPVKGPFGISLKNHGQLGWFDDPVDRKNANVGFIVEWDDAGGTPAAPPKPVANSPVKWHDMLKEWRGPGNLKAPGWKDEGGRVEALLKPTRGVALPAKIVSPDQALRITCTAATMSEHKILLRYTQSPLDYSSSNYEFDIGSSGHVWLYVSQGEKSERLKNWPAPPGFDPKALQTWEFRAVGDTLSAYLEGRLIGSVTDGRLKEGIPRVFNFDQGTVITALEYASLDGMSLDAPSATTTNSEKWVDVLAKILAKGPGDGSFDALTKVADGAEVKRRDPPIGMPLGPPSDDIAVRVRVRGIKGTVTFSLRGAGGIATGDMRSYIAHLRTDGSGVIQRRDANDKLVKLADFPAIPAFDKAATHTVEFRAEGDLLTLRVDGQTLGTVRDATFAKGGTAYFVGDPGMVIEALEYLDLSKASPSAASSSPNLPVSSSSVATATKYNPFINTLGMKFVPVPITGGPTDKQRVLFSVWVTRVQDYEVFVKETKREWLKPNFDQGPTHPAANVSWEDATAFCTWLTERERKAGKLSAGEVYRLPSDHEWSCGVGIGDKEDAAKLPSDKSGKINEVFPWGTQWPPPQGAGNYAGEESQSNPAARNSPRANGAIAGYADGFVYTSTVDSFSSNRFGLHDMGETCGSGVTTGMIRTKGIALCGVVHGLTTSAALSCPPGAAVLTRAIGSSIMASASCWMRPRRLPRSSYLPSPRDETPHPHPSSFSPDQHGLCPDALAEGPFRSGCGVQLRQACPRKEAVWLLAAGGEDWAYRGGCLWQESSRQCDCRRAVWPEGHVGS